MTGYHLKAAIRALNNLELKGSRMRVKKAEASPSVADAAPVEEALAPETAVPETAGKPAGPRIKKNGIPLGPRKSRVFRKKS